VTVSSETLFVDRRHGRINETMLLLVKNPPEPVSRRLKRGFRYLAMIEPRTHSSASVFCGICRSDILATSAFSYVVIITKTTTSGKRKTAFAICESAVSSNVRPRCRGF
jgi:hypothetical protein